LSEEQLKLKERAQIAEDGLLILQAEVNSLKVDRDQAVQNANEAENEAAELRVKLERAQTRPQVVPTNEVEEELRRRLVDAESKADDANRRIGKLDKDLEEK